MVKYKKHCAAIMAVDDNFGVGYKNDLPWPKNKKDLIHFKDTTLGSVIVMGHNTWKSIGSKKLAGRINIVISNKEVSEADETYSGEIEDIIKKIKNKYINEHIFIIGGPKLIEECAEKNILDYIILSHIAGKYKSDTFLNKSVLVDYVNVYNETINDKPETVVAHYFNKKMIEGII